MNEVNNPDNTPPASPTTSTTTVTTPSTSAPLPKIKKEWQLWLNTFTFGVVSYALMTLYIFLRGDPFDLYNVNRVIAGVSLFLIGLSFILSGVCYFWDKLDSFIVYRKYLGLLGFGMAVAHIFVTVLYLQERYALDQWLTTRIVPFLLGLGSTIIFTFMAAISTQWAAKKIGGRWWRKILRWGGYIAYILLLGHVVMAKQYGWNRWLENMDTWMPPLSMLGVVFIVVVLGMRVALWWSVRRQPKRM